MSGAAFLVLAGSVRPNRRAPAIAAWVAGLGASETGAAFTVVDLLDLGLGMADEAGIPARDDYEMESTRRWSALVAEARGVVIVTPQYNWGYPAALKNAIDHLYREWKAKPVLIVSYGGHGGGKCAAQLREVMTGVGANLVAAMPGLALARARIEANDGQVEPEVDFADQRADVIAALEALVNAAG